MVIFCRSLKKYVFQLNSLKVYWSKRGHYTATSKAGAGPGLGNGEIESQGTTPTEAVDNLRLALITRREALQAKIAEVEQALEQIRYTGHNAQDLLLLPKEGEIKRGNTK
jgi:transposase